MVFGISFSGYYFVSVRLLNYLEHGQNIFIWGDSQTYQGLNMEMLNDRFNNSAVSFAKHGAKESQE